MQKLFEKNIKYFYTNLPHFYKLITSIKTRRYKIYKNNILDTKTNTLVYPSSIEDYSKLITSNPLNNNLWKKDFFSINPSLWEDNFYITGKIINKLINKTYKLPHTQGFYFDKDFLPTTIIFGLLAGKHLDLLVDKYHFHSLFVYEPNPEFFALSLYFVDYEKIYSKLGNRFFIWVKGKVDYFAIEKFFKERTITSSFFNIYFQMYEHKFFEDALKKFKEVRVSNLRGWGTYEDEMKGIKNHKQNINKYPILKETIEINVPFCIVANGKSLEKNIEFIKKNKDSMIIISVGTALKPLIKAEIESDFHIEQERIDLLVDALKDILPNYNGIFVGANVVNPKVFKMTKNPYMYIREGFTFSKFYPTPLIFSSPLVGNAGVSFAANFTKEIYLCGMDLGFRLGEKKHSKNSFYDKEEDIEKEGIKIEGNFSDDIYTNSLFLSSKFAIEQLIKMKNLKVFNLSDGAYIKGSISLKDKTLPKIEKEKYKKEIIKAFTNEKYSENPPKLYPLLNAISVALKQLNIKDYKHLTGTIDFLEDLITAYRQKDPSAYSLLRGSLWHILLHFYILAHKLENKKDINKLAKIIKKEIFKFDEQFKKDYQQN